MFAKARLVLAVLGLLLTLIISAEAQDNVCDLENSMILSTLTHGVTCLDEAGWHTLENPGLSAGSFDAIDNCPDGSIAAAHIFGISLFDGAQWTEGPENEIFGTRDIACGENGELWVAGMDGLGHYDGSAWTIYEVDEFGTSPFIMMIEQVEIAADGSVWARTGYSVARFDGSAWTVYENGSGFNDVIAISGLALTDDGGAWAVESNGLMYFDGSNWQRQPSDLLTLRGIAVDAENRVWVGSVDAGLSVFDGSGWQTFNRENSGLISNKVASVDVDAQGRVWAGTEWGLSVYDGAEWINLTMGNSEIPDNDIRLVSVNGAGPALPELVSKAGGTVTGVLENGREPLAGARVELCTETIGGVFYGDTPCAGQPDSQLVTSGDTGEFTFENVPAGRYEIVIESPTGWIQFIGADTTIEVFAGDIIDLADIDVSE